MSSQTVQMCRLFITLWAALQVFAFGIVAANDDPQKCSTLPQVQKRLSAVIIDCQNQVKENMIREALQRIQQGEHQGQALSAYPGYPQNPGAPLANEEIHWMMNRNKRSLPGEFYDHPTIMSDDDKEIAGVCLQFAHLHFKETN